MIYVLLIALVGLWDDFVTRFQPISRLTLVLTISMFAFLNDAVPMTLSAYEWLPLEATIRMRSMSLERHRLGRRT